MKLYKITVKKHQYNYNCYDGFIIVANTIPEALEYMYKRVCRTSNKNVFNDIPYYLRSSNLNIEELGNFEPKDELDEPIIMADYTPA